MLFGIFGLGVPEIIILGLVCVLPTIIAAVVLAIVFMSNKRPPSDRDHPRPDDDRD